MSTENNQSSKPFRFAIEGEPTALLIDTLLQMRASVDALAVFSIEMLVELTGKDPKETAKRYEELREKFLLEHAFKLQEQYPVSPPPDTKE